LPWSIEAKHLPWEGAAWLRLLRRAAQIRFRAATTLTDTPDLTTDGLVC